MAAIDRELRWSALMRAANRGDRSAYERLLGEIALLLRSTVRHRLAELRLGADEVEDVVQETLLGLHLKRDTWSEERPFLPWVHAIARYKTLDAARRLGRTRRNVVDLPIEDWADTLAAPSPERDTARLDTERMVAALPSRERGIVEALSLDGLSIAGAAQRFGISQGAVRVAFHRGLARLARLASAEPGASTSARRI